VRWSISYDGQRGYDASPVHRFDAEKQHDDPSAIRGRPRSHRRGSPPSGVPPHSDRTGLLQAWAQDCLQEAEQWSASPPTRRELDVLMKRLLALHVEVTKLERERDVA
jgi:hypothetical protein